MFYCHFNENSISTVNFTIFQKQNTHFLWCSIHSKWILHSRAIQVLFFVYVVQNSLVLGHEEITKIQKNVIKQSGSLSWKQSITVSKSSKCHRILILNLPGIAWHLWINQFDITQSGIDFIWNCYRIFFNLEYKSSATGDRILRIVIIILTLSTLSTMSFHGSPYYQWVCLIEDIFYVVIALNDVIMIVSCHWRKSAPYLLWYGKSVEKSTYSRIFHASSTFFLVSKRFF